MIRPLYILRLALAVLLLLLALAPAKAQMSVYQGETTTLTVVEVPGQTYEWEIYDDGTVNFAAVPGNCPVASANFVGSNTGASVDVQWFKPGIYFYKVTARDAAGCTMNLKIGKVEVKESSPTAIIIQPDPDWICEGETAILEIKISGKGPWDLTYTDGINSWTIKGINNPDYQLRVSPKAPSSYWVTQVINANGTNTKPSEAVWVIVYPKPVSSKIYPSGP